MPETGPEKSLGSVVKKITEWNRSVKYIKSFYWGGGCKPNLFEPLWLIELLSVKWRGVLGLFGIPSTREEHPLAFGGSCCVLHFAFYGLHFPQNTCIFSVLSGCKAWWTSDTALTRKWVVTVHTLEIQNKGSDLPGTPSSLHLGPVGASESLRGAHPCCSSQAGYTARRRWNAGSSSAAATPFPGMAHGWSPRPSKVPTKRGDEGPTRNDKHYLRSFRGPGGNWDTAWARFSLDEWR